MSKQTPDNPTGADNLIDVEGMAATIAALEDTGQRFLAVMEEIFEMLRGRALQASCPDGCFLTLTEGRRTAANIRDAPSGQLLGVMEIGDCWPVTGVTFTTNETNAQWYRFDGEDGEAWIAASILDEYLFLTQGCNQIPWIDPNESDLEAILIAIGIDLSDEDIGEYDVVGVLEELSQYNLTFDTNNPILMADIVNIILPALAELSSYSVTITGGNWTAEEIVSVQTTVRDSIAKLADLVGEEQAIAAYQAIFGISETGLIILDRENSIEGPNGIAGRNNSERIFLWGNTFTSEDWIPEMLIGHEIAHNVTLKYYYGDPFYFGGEIILYYETPDGSVVRCETALSSEETNQYFANLYISTGDYTATRRHEVQCNDQSTLSLEPGDTFRFKFARDGLLYSVASEPIPSERVADALSVYLLALYDDNNDDCNLRLAASVRREQAETIVRSLLIYEDFLEVSGECPDE